MEILNLRPIPIAVTTTNFKLNKKEKKELLKLSYDKDDSNLGISNSHYIFNNKTFKRIEELLFNFANDYKENIIQISNEIYVTQSWATLNEKNSQHHLHSHKASLFSVIYYAESEGNNKLYFTIDKSSIQEGFDFSYTIKNYNIYNSENWFIQIKANQIIIFPGWLKHYSINEGHKLMIGSNYFIKGKIGYTNRKDFIELK